MLACLTTRERVLLGVVGLVVAATAALEYGGGSDVAVFVVAALALAGVAWVVSFSTEAVGERFGPALTGVLQSTLGNLPELFVVLFALSAGELVVAQYSILGSIFANALLVLGLVILAGARAAGGVMRFGRKLPNDTATLLLLAVFIISLLGFSDQAGDRASQHQVEISAIGAVVLLAVYGVWLFFYLRDAEGGKPVTPRVPLRLSVGLLAVAGVAAAFVSDWFVGSLGPAIESLGISEEFTGLVIVGIAGNAVENVVGVVLAHKGQSDLAISVVKNSVAQIAVFLFPLLVLLSLFLETRLTFVLPTVYIAALFLMAISVWQTTQDGEAAALRGARARRLLRDPRRAYLLRRVRRPQPLSCAPAPRACASIVEDLTQIGTYRVLGGFDEWLHRRGLPLDLDCGGRHRRAAEPNLETLERLAELFEAGEAVPAREQVDMGERRLHAAGERLVGRILLQRVEPDDSVREAGEARHLRGEEVWVADLEPVGADQDECASASPPWPCSSRNAFSDSPMRVPPSQSTTSDAARARASSASGVASERVTRVRRVPKQKASTRRPNAARRARTSRAPVSRDP